MSRGPTALPGEPTRASGTDEGAYQAVRAELQTRLRDNTAAVTLFIDAHRDALLEIFATASMQGPPSIEWWGPAWTVTQILIGQATGGTGSLAMEVAALAGEILVEAVARAVQATEVAARNAALRGLSTWGTTTSAGVRLQRLVAEASEYSEWLGSLHGNLARLPEFRLPPRLPRASRGSIRSALLEAWLAEHGRASPRENAESSGATSPMVPPHEGQESALVARPGVDHEAFARVLALYRQGGIRRPQIGAALLRAGLEQRGLVANEEITPALVVRRSLVARPGMSGGTGGGTVRLLWDLSRENWPVQIHTVQEPSAPERISGY